MQGSGSLVPQVGYVSSIYDSLIGQYDKICLGLFINGAKNVVVLCASNFFKTYLILVDIAWIHGIGLLFVYTPIYIWEYFYIVFLSHFWHHNSLILVHTYSNSFCFCVIWLLDKYACGFSCVYVNLSSFVCVCFKFMKYSKAAF